jgi:transposase
LIAAKLLGEIAGIDRFATDAKLARTAGAAPIPASSGRTSRHRLDRGGNRQLNLALHRLAITKSVSDPETKAYLAKKTAEGKTRREAMRCLKRHLARRIFLLLQPTDTAFENVNQAHLDHTDTCPEALTEQVITIHCATRKSGFLLT